MCTFQEHGTKKSKARVTIVFWSNMTGSQKLRLHVIGKPKRPRCFGKRKFSSLPCDYRSAPKGWMTSDLFATLLVQFNLKMKTVNRSVLLLVDGAGCSSTFVCITYFSTAFSH